MGRSAKGIGSTGASETRDRLGKRVEEIIKRLSEVFPDPRTALEFSNPLELLVATVLSAQCTDERVNGVTRSLFHRYRTAWDYARAEQSELEEQIRPTGFFRQKARSIQEMCRGLVDRFGGEVPRRMEELVTLPGIGRKTANLILSEAFGIPGIVVDTHVKRVAGRIGLTKQTDPEKIERDLMDFVPRDHWSLFSNLLIWHGRRTCQARKPRCPQCGIHDLCGYPSKTL